MIIKITLTKHRATWHYTAHNDVGGSYGSNHCGSKKVALHKAAAAVAPGEPFELITNGKNEGRWTVNAQTRKVEPWIL
jgi:hypothetical protein